MDLKYYGELGGYKTPDLVGLRRMKTTEDNDKFDLNKFPNN